MLFLWTQTYKTKFYHILPIDLNFRIQKISVSKIRGGSLIKDTNGFSKHFSDYQNIENWLSYVNSPECPI